MTEQHAVAANGSGPAQRDPTAAAPARLDPTAAAPAQRDPAAPARRDPDLAAEGLPAPDPPPQETAPPAADPAAPGDAARAVEDGGQAGDPGAWPPDELLEAVELDERGWMRCELEAILLVADEPVPAATLAEVIGQRLTRVEELLIELAAEYARDARGFVLRAVAGGWRLYTHPGARSAVEAYVRAGQQSRLTRAALETLAVIAYRQPVARFQVAAVRGVNVDGVFRTLLARGLIREVGRHDGPGQAVLYGTTDAFLEQLGLNSLDELPPIKDYLPDGVDLTDLQEQL
jgi:segregation and condensation protein B